MARKNSADVAREIRKSIEEGTYRRFERLPPSRQLASTIGVARNTLREALFQLESEGLLETRPSSGTYVTAPAKDQVPSAVEDSTPLELIDARFALEPHICRLCVLHGRRDDFDVLDALCTQMEASIHDPVGFAEADARFHRALAMATRNALLIWLIGQINSARATDEWMRMRHVTLDEAIIRKYNHQHREILTALRSREPERAAIRMKEHLETARVSLMRAAEA